MRTHHRLFAIAPVAVVLGLAVFTLGAAPAPVSHHSYRPSTQGLAQVAVPVPTTTAPPPTTIPPPPPVVESPPTTVPAPETTTTAPPEAPPVAAPAPQIAAVAPRTGGSDATSTGTADWACIRWHESGDSYNDPSKPSGAYGILASTAASEGLPYPVSNAAPGAQDAAALDLYAKYGWAPWSTASICGL